MKNYVKPVVLTNDEMFEGVYTASGTGEDCYTASAYITQTPQTGRENFVVHVDAVHAAGNGHHSGRQILTLYFNQPVKYLYCNATNGTAALNGGDGTATLQIVFNYHANASENHGLGDVYVESADGLAVNSIAKLECDYGVNDPNQDHLSMW